MKKLRFISFVFFFLMATLIVVPGVQAAVTQDPVNPLDAATLDSLNPLTIANSNQADQLSTPGGILSRVLEFAFPIAGLALFLMITWGGFEIVAGASNKKSQDAGKQRVTAAVVGFLLLFASYWLIQLVEIVFNVQII